MKFFTIQHARFERGKKKSENIFCIVCSVFVFSMLVWNDVTNWTRYIIVKSRTFFFSLYIVFCCV